MQKQPYAAKDDVILREATDLVEYMYDTVLKQFSDFGDEKWNTERKIRNSANDVIFYVAQAVGSVMSDAVQYEWNSARKDLLGLRTMYVFAGKQSFIELEPSIVVRMDKLIAEIDIQIELNKKDTERRTKQELKPWLEKYRLWKEMQADPPKPRKR